MRLVYVADDLVSAELLRERLYREGIVTKLRNEHLQGALGELPLNLRPEICVVNEADFERARQLVTAYESEQQQPLGEDWTCSCGETNPSNFESCWSCRSLRPDLA